MPTTPKNFRFPLGTELANEIDLFFEQLATDVDDRVVQAMTTVERDALAGGDRWSGRTIRNTTTGQHEFWDGAAWRVAVPQALVWRRLRTGRWHTSQAYQSMNVPAGSLLGDVGSIHAVPFLVAERTSFDRIGIYQPSSAAAAQVFRMGIYDDDGSYYPGARLLDAGEATLVQTGTASHEIVIAHALNPGLYWLVGKWTGAANTSMHLRAFTPGSVSTVHAGGGAVNTQGDQAGYRPAYRLDGQVQGALAAAFPAAALPVYSAPMIHLRAT